MVILTIDIGNTRAKLVVFAGGQVIDHRTAPHDALVATLHNLLAAHPQTERIHWCSVGPDLSALSDFFAACPLPVHRLLPTAPPAGVQVTYATPHTLGADRLAAVLGARALRPASDLLVIDAGTCITYDLLTAGGVYLGGNISPGLDMRLRALADQTARLPHVAAAGPTPLMGDSTETAIRSGVVRGIAYEIEGYVRTLAAEYPNLCVFLTGGNRFDFPISPEIRTFADDYLVARGLAVL
ncbi:MAG: type III pantothenate kinase [Bacteroidaceae bacterium]|nr:type III pantothenate kinase [Bacteroidaceae bacterium]